MSIKPLFSVVIPTYNHAHLIGKCLDSLIAQTFTDWEAIVVNNFSDDNTIDVVESYADTRIKLINNHNDGIIAVSRNKGIEESCGEWICFLDSDDWWTPNKLEGCLPYLAHYDMLYHDMYIFNQDKGLEAKKRIRCRIPSSPIFENLLQYGNCCPNSSVVLRRSIIDKVGPLSEDKGLVAVEDFDYWLRVSRVTERFFQLPLVLGYYWVGATSISFNEKHIGQLETIYNKYLLYVADEHLKSKVIKHKCYVQGRLYQMLGMTDKAVEKYKIAWHSRDIRYKIKSAIWLILLTLKSRKTQ